MSYKIPEWTANWAQSQNLPIWIEPETASTNDIAKQEGFTIEAAHKIYLTGLQSQGRGRHGRTWVTHIAGSSLLSTWRIELDTPPQHLTGPLLGLSLFRAARTKWPSLEWSLKAPNDLYLRDKKIAGILTETLSQGQKYILLVGLGMNIEDAPDSIDHSTYLCSQDGLGNSINEDEWHGFLQTLWKELTSHLEAMCSSQLNQQQRSEILEALNACPAQQQPLIDISHQGHLVTENGSIDWHEL